MTSRIPRARASLVASAAVLAAVSGLALCGPAAGVAAEAPPAETALTPKVTVVEALTREIGDTLVVTGTLVPRDEVLVTPEIDGQRITEVLVEEGAHVARGQVLARLSHDLIDRQLDGQKALVDKATAAVPQAESTIAQVEAEAQESTLAYARAQELVKSGATTAAVMESRTAAMRQAQSRLSYARSGLAVAKADLAQAEAVRDELVLRLARTDIRAPEAGIVSRRTARVGMIASAAAEPLFRLIARGEIELEGEVMETRLAEVHEGAPAWIAMDDGTRMPGRVRAVYPEVDRATRLGKVRIGLAADPRLRIGSFARGGIELARTRGVVIPLASILYQADRPGSVLVVDGGKVARREVRTGLGNGTDVQVLDGVVAGDAVVARAGSFLQDGDRVRAIPAERAATVTGRAEIAAPPSATP